MANLAQLGNVLQAPILTDGPAMLLTPTYHVLEMFKGHQGAKFLPSQAVGPHYTVGGTEVEQLHASSSRSADGVVNVSLCNLHDSDGLEVTCAFEGLTASAVEGRCLAGETIQDKNTFEEPEAVMPREIVAEVSGGGVRLTLPPHSVAVLHVRVA